jgi:hypothetical protein
MIRIAEPQPTDDGPYEYRGHFSAELQNERWYDPTIGHWLNEEPIALVDDANLPRDVWAINWKSG